MTSEDIKSNKKSRDNSSIANKIKLKKHLNFFFATRKSLARESPNSIGARENDPLPSVYLSIRKTSLEM